MDRLAREVADALPKDADPDKRLEALNRFLFQERGFHGSRLDYYSRNNSYLNEVIDDREGMPITLSVLYMELARRLDLNVVGVGLPGHFVVRHEPKEGKGQLIDVFDGGKLLDEDQAAKKSQGITGKLPAEKSLAAVSKKAILTRMLHNLVGIAEREKDRDGMLRYLDAILVIDPEAHDERWVRAVFRFQAGLREGGAKIAIGCSNASRKASSWTGSASCGVWCRKNRNSSTDFADYTDLREQRATLYLSVESVKSVDHLFTTNARGCRRLASGARRWRRPDR